MKIVKSGAFDTIEDPKDFGKKLQNLIQGVTHDKHLRILYDLGMVKELELMKTKTMEDEGAGKQKE